MLDRHPRRGDAPERKTTRHRSRLDGENDLHCRRVVLEVEPRPEADLDHTSLQPRGDHSPPARQALGAARPVDQSGKHLLAVEAHAQP